MTAPFNVAPNTCRYCSQLVVPVHRGTLVVVNAACRGVGTTGGTPGVRNWRYSALISTKSRCKRATVSIKMFSGNHMWYVPTVRTNILIPNFHKDLGSHSCTPLRQTCPRSLEVPCPTPYISRRGGGNCGAGASRSSASRSSIPPVASASRPLGSSVTDVGHPTRFHLGRPPCRGSILNQSSH